MILLYACRISKSREQLRPALLAHVIVRMMFASMPEHLKALFFDPSLSDRCKTSLFITFCNNIEFYCKLKHFSNSSSPALMVLWLLLRLNSDTII
jgi:ABC-type enterochelin transport system permease subunit